MSHLVKALTNVTRSKPTVCFTHLPGRKGSTDNDLHPGKYHYNWYGRSAPQVQEDRHQQAVDAGVYKPRKKVPDAEGGDKFWVVDPKTHASNLHSFSDIQTNFKGSWQIDDRFGSSYFLKRGDKAPAGWDSD